MINNYMLPTTTISTEYISIYYCYLNVSHIQKEISSIYSNKYVRDMLQILFSYIITTQMSKNSTVNSTIVTKPFFLTLVSS